MKNLKSYIGLMLAAIVGLGVATSCQDDFDAPGIRVPVAKKHPNTKIADFKAEYWDDATNYYKKVPVGADGKHIIIAGRVTSSDAAGNIYKNLVIQDETASLTMSINAYSLYNKYRIGQEVVVDLTDMYVGKYSSLQQMGFPDSSVGYGDQTTFMPYEFFVEHSELNGLPQPSKVDTLTISIGDLSNDAATYQKYQSQLVRFNNVHFEDGGEKSFCDGSQIDTNRNLKDANGNTIVVRTSGYANFWSVKLPAESGDVVGILGTYASGSKVAWQLTLRSVDDLINFGDPTLPKGTDTNPYDVLDVVSLAKSGTQTSGWSTGYIVGYVKPGVSNVTTTEDIIWNAEPDPDFGLTLDNTLIVGQTAAAHSLDDVMLVRLPDGSALKEVGNLKDNAGNIGKQIWIYGTYIEDMGLAAVGGNNGSASEFRIEGATVPGAGDAIPTGDGSQTSPYNAAQVVGFGVDANVPNIWLKGYIVGWIDNTNQNFADATNCIFSVPATSATNVLLATNPNETDFSKCVAINLPTGNIRTAVNLLDNHGNLGKVVSLYGTARKYFAMPGLRDITDFTLESGGDTPTGGSLYKQTFGDGLGNWSIHNVVLPAAASYIWNADSYGYMKASAYISGTSYASESWLVSPMIDMTAATNTALSFDHCVNKFPSLDVAKEQTSLWISVAGGDWQELAIPTYNDNTSWTFTTSGTIDLSAYAGKKVKLGFKYKSADGASGTWEVKNVDITGSGTITVTDDTTFPGGGSTGGGNTGGGETGGGNTGGGETGGGTTGGEAVDATSADLNTMNGGAPKATYGTYKSDQNWVATNAQILSGAAEGNTSPAFNFISSDPKTLAVALNGKTTTPGTLTSPKLSGGIKALSFSYGLPFSDTKIGLTVRILQDGVEVASTEISNSSATKLEAYSFNWTLPTAVTGDFTIEIINTCPSQSTSNKDRVAVWNITWTR